MNLRPAVNLAASVIECTVSVSPSSFSCAVTRDRGAGGMILLVAMIGAIVLTFRKRSGVKTQSYLRQISRERSEGVELVDVESNKGVKFDD